VLETWADALTVRLNRINPEALMLILGALVGIGSGFVAVGFRSGIDLCNQGFEYVLNVLSTINPHLVWLMPLAPGLGGLAVGVITRHFAREAKGHGVPEVMQAVAVRGGALRKRIVLLKGVTAAITLGSNGSAGPEGPIVQMGGALGSAAAQGFRLSVNRRKTLLGCGVAGGLSAIFNAPIAGMLFALEVILGDFRITTFSPVILSSVLASAVAHSFMGVEPAFKVPPYTLVSPWEFFGYAALGVVCGLVSIGLGGVLDVLEERFQRLKAPEWLKPGIGGLLAGVVALSFKSIGLPGTAALGEGYRPISLALNGHMVPLALLVLLLLKPVTTGLTLGSGGSGGVFAPAMFVGAMIGGLVGYAMLWLFPGLTASLGTSVFLPGAYALVGMGAVVAGTTHALLTSLVMIFEMTNHYRIILPLMLTIALSVAVSRALSRESIYTRKLKGRVSHGLDYSVLDQLRVAMVMFTNYVQIRPDARLEDVVATAKGARSYDFPVVTEEGRLAGMISLPDISTATEAGVPDLLLASDLAVGTFPRLTPGESLSSALRKFDAYDRPTLPVVSEGKPDYIVGMVDRRQILNLHERISLLGRPSEDQYSAWHQIPY